MKILENLLEDGIMEDRKLGICPQALNEISANFNIAIVTWG